MVELIPSTLKVKRYRSPVTCLGTFTYISFYYFVIIFYYYSIIIKRILCRCTRLFEFEFEGEGGGVGVDANSRLGAYSNKYGSF